MKKTSIEKLAGAEGLSKRTNTSSPGLQFLPMLIYAHPGLCLITWSF